MIRGKSHLTKPVQIGFGVAGGLWIFFSLIIYWITAPTFINGQAWDLIDPIPIEEADALMWHADVGLSVGFIVAVLHIGIAVWYRKAIWLRWMGPIRSIE